jgi:hypothetical protein
MRASILGMDAVRRDQAVDASGTTDTDNASAKRRSPCRVRKKRIHQTAWGSRRSEHVAESSAFGSHRLRRRLQRSDPSISSRSGIGTRPPNQEVSISSKLAPPTSFWLVGNGRSARRCRDPPTRKDEVAEVVRPSPARSAIAAPSAFGSTPSRRSKSPDTDGCNNALFSWRFPPIHARRRRTSQ